jgi:hypothetical protein
VIALVVFGLEWTAFSALWLVLAVVLVLKGGLQGNNPLWSPVCFPLFGVPFALFGVWMVTAPLRARRTRRNTAYAVTDQRAVILVRRFWGVRVEAFAPEELAEVSRVERPDGSGDLILSESVSTDGDGYQRTRQVGFFGVIEVRRVEARVRELAAKVNSSS